MATHPDLDWTAIADGIEAEAALFPEFEPQDEPDDDAILDALDALDQTLSETEEA